MKKLLLLSLLASGLLAGTVQAEPMFTYTSRDYCQIVAGLATGFAEDREQGRSLEDTHQVITDASLQGKDSALDLHKVVEIIYQYPRLIPSAEGNVIYSLCREE